MVVSTGMKNEPLSPQQIDEYLAHSVNNGTEILRSRQAGCFFCESLFSAKEIHDWDSQSNSLTAVCPRCGMHSVIGDAFGLPLDEEILHEVRKARFTDDYISLHADIAVRYCQNYLNGLVCHNPMNEALFVRYCDILADLQHQGSALILGNFYEIGGEFTPPDLTKALHYYRRPELHTNPDALVGIGRIMQRWFGENKHDMLAYEYYSQAAALGSYAGVYQVAQCYFDGYGVKKDPEMGFAMLQSAYADVFQSFTNSQNNVDDFVNYSLRLGECYQKGIVVKKDPMAALRYNLLAEFGCSTQNGFTPDIEENAAIRRKISRRIHMLAKPFSFTKGEPVYDQDSFYDSFCDSPAPALPKFFSLKSWDPTTGILRFTVRYMLPPLIVDLANLYCGIAGEEIEWEFHDIAEFRMAGEQDTIFDRIVSPDDNSWSFEHVSSSGQGQESIYLRFRPKADEEEDGILEEKPSDEKNK